MRLKLGRPDLGAYRDSFDAPAGEAESVERRVLPAVVILDAATGPAGGTQLRRSRLHPFGVRLNSHKLALSAVSPACA